VGLRFWFRAWFRRIGWARGTVDLCLPDIDCGSQHCFVEQVLLFSFRVYFGFESDFLENLVDEVLMKVLGVEFVFLWALVVVFFQIF
jgi:hypothetical protein